MMKKHVFAICAYKESPFLEECIRSIKEQTVQSNVIITTSTPNEYIRELSEKYQIPLYVNEGEKGITQDWNFAYSKADAEYVTIAHQDDVYLTEYSKCLVEQLRKKEDALIAFTDYSELRNGIQKSDGKNLKIKRILLSPMKKKMGSEKKVWKRFVLRFGNAICCPTVTYHKTKLDKLLQERQQQQLFQQHFRSNLDWQTWEWLSCEKGRFIYIPQILMSHRIHEESETSVTIQDNLRGREDYEMFCKFWPKSIARLLTRLYSESEKSNEL